jgi:hypothetical protein
MIDLFLFFTTGTMMIRYMDLLSDKYNHTDVHLKRRRYAPELMLILIHISLFDCMLYVVLEYFNGSQGCSGVDSG